VRGATDDERRGHNLIRLVELDLGDSPSVARDVFARPEKELQEDLAARGLRPAGS
jgi:hypothetical protein